MNHKESTKMENDNCHRRKRNREHGQRRVAL